MKTLEVSGIEEGTVIDHIPQGKVFTVVKVLKLENAKDKVFLGANLHSKRSGKKGILKVAGKVLSQKETNKLALVAPEATVNIIKGFDVVKKRNIELPDYVSGICTCINPNCVTNKQPVKTKMHIIKKKPVHVRCHYCERVMDQSEIKIA